MNYKHQTTDFHAIMMYSRPYKERDLLVKYFTEEFGIKMFLMRGAKKPNFKMRAALLPFADGWFSGSVSGNGLSYLNNIKEVRQYSNVNADIVLNAYVTYLVSLLDAAFAEGQVQPSWFARLQLAIKMIDSGADVDIITNIMEIQLLTEFGVAPNWRDCSVCHRTDSAFDFSEEYGGLLCQNHWSLDPYRLHLDQRTIYYLRLFSVVQLSQINTIDINEQTKKAIRRTIDKIYENSVGIVPKSKRFLDQIDQLKF